MPKGTCSIEGCDYPACTRSWCVAHYQRWLKHGDPLAGGTSKRHGPPAERFWRKVDKDGPIPAHRPELGPCWLWTGAKSHGYGRFKVDGEAINAHRWAYEETRGPVPDGFELDHICHSESGCPGGECFHRLCVNPDHLEAVTHTENLRRGQSPLARHARKTHCIHGHPFDAANTLMLPGGGRECRACHRNNVRKNRVAKRARARLAAETRAR